MSVHHLPLPADQTGDVGTLYRIASLDDVKDFQSASDDDYIALITEKMLYMKTDGFVFASELAYPHLLFVRVDFN